MRSTLKILMYLKKANEKPNENVPLMCRLTVDASTRTGKFQLNIDEMEIYDWVRHKQKKSFFIPSGLILRRINKRKLGHNIIFGIINSYIQIIIYLCITIGVLWTIRS